ncbi:MAG: outer membrane protein assembly factor BamB [Chlamydiales bacterium]|jgi:outer membrane protein assembly factor BamB
MKPLISLICVSTLLVCSSARSQAATEPSSIGRQHQEGAVGVRTGWLSWRGPDQNGTSPETGLIDTLVVDGENHLWSYPISGRGTPVVSNGRVFGMGYEGEGTQLEEVLFCLDEATGSLIWEHRNPDFLSDVIYSRYAIGSPTVDPATGNLFAMTAGGLLHGFTPDGQQLWERSLIEDLGRLSFPNGRVGAPLILGDRVIIHFIFAAWGPLGPARDRFFAFDKTTGDVIWASTPGGPPKDSSYGMPVFEERDGRQLLYACLGGGHVACIDARTGDPVWRFPLVFGGMSTSAVLDGDRVIAVHGKENIDSSAIGRMVSLSLDKAPDETGVLAAGAEVWRNKAVAFTSSPVLADNRIYQTVQTGDLVCIDAETGETLWHQKLGADQLHASPLAADGKLYVPMNDGSLFIIKPSDEGMEILGQVQLEGACLGAPAVSGGRIYVHTTDRLYCFGKPADGAPVWPTIPEASGSDAVRLQLVPADVTLRAGEKPSFTVRALDAKGRFVREIPSDQVAFSKPPVCTSGQPGVGTVTATSGDLTGTARVRVVPTLPHHEDFSSFELDQGGDAPFAFPPGHWLGARIKWKVIDLDGERVVARRLDNPLFQRTISLLGDDQDSNYTVQADMMSDGNRRTLCMMGVINQRYLIRLKGNHQTLEVSSNKERLMVDVPFKIKKGVWYTMKTRVDVASDGSGFVRAKVWTRGEDEPEAWTIEVPDPHVQTHGAAGVYSFTPQSRFAAYIDNIHVTPND